MSLDEYVEQNAQTTQALENLYAGIQSALPPADPVARSMI